MKMMLKCREATALVLQGEDRRLSVTERLALRFHLLICKACTRFVGQVGLMRSAMGPWRAYRDQGQEP
ncbi:MAG: zf-HC2 domain-containing protein [Vitreoscilla sp.]|nr:zf-HC2 domain-containing protein [Burkholderiales bacterium]MBP6336641.1 zf-HC2 domain-containing protein [Vitreoscilla sp.]MBP6675206.1 zf-HC2 domain-containing protein [Vitreoscilla sp.]